MECLLGGVSSARDGSGRSLARFAVQLRLGIAGAPHAPGLTELRSMQVPLFPSTLLPSRSSRCGSHLSKTVLPHSLDFGRDRVLLTAPFRWVRVSAICGESRCASPRPRRRSLLEEVEPGSAAGVTVGLRHSLGLPVPLCGCGLKTTLSLQGWQSLVTINVCRTLRGPRMTPKKGKMCCWGS